MAVWNNPVVTILNDHDYTATLKITGQYNAACTGSNTVVLQANTLKGANTSKLCLVEVDSVQAAIGTTNGIITLEFVAANGNNATISTFRGGQGSLLVQGVTNPLVTNTTATVATAVGDINLGIYNFGANDTFDLIVTVRKSDFNGAFANVGLAYDSAWGRGNTVSWLGH